MHLRDLVYGLTFLVQKMWFPKNTNLDQISENTLFIALLWREMFGKYTTDTYRPKLMGVPSLLKELNKIGKLGCENERWTRHGRIIVEELCRVAESDPVLEKYAAQVLYAINSLKCENRPTTWCTVSQFCLEQIDDYPQWVVKDLLSLVVDKNELKKKDATKKLMSCLATIAIQSGLGRQLCESFITEDSLTLNADELVESIVAKINGLNKTWSCVYAIKNEAQMEPVTQILAQTDFEFYQKHERPSGGEKWHQFLKTTVDCRLIYLQIESTDPQSAAHKGLQQLEYVVSLINFFHNAAPLKIVPKIFATAGQEQFFAQLDAESISGLKPHTNATERALQIYAETQWEKTPKELISSLELRSSAYEATEVSLRFTNLWAALETISSARPESSVYERVIETIVPIMMTGQIRKRVKYAAICCLNAKLLDHLDHECSLFSNPDPENVTINPGELFKILTSKTQNPTTSKWENTDLIVHIFPNVNTLLRNRLLNLWSHFTDPKQVLNGFDESQKQLEQQIERIYRARNLIVHHGERPDNLPYLLKNLEYYLATVLTSVFHDFTKKPSTTVIDSLEKRRLDYGFLKHTLKTKSHVLLASQLLGGSEEINDFVVWPKN